MQPITKEETFGYINSTSIQAKSVGLNRFPTKPLKLVSGIPSKPLSIILDNISLNFRVTFTICMSSWEQPKTVCFSIIVSLQNREIRIIHFCPRNFPNNILYLTSKILRFYDLIQFLNCSSVWMNYTMSFLPYFVTTLIKGHRLGIA